MKVDYRSSTKKIQLKENSTDNSAEKYCKENSKLMNFETFRYKKKKRKRNRKILEFKELRFSDTLSDKFPANCTKN